MANIIGDLLANARALNAHSRGAETAGRNLANVNNPDYARQRVLLGDRGTISTAEGPRGLGLEAQGVEHLRNRILDRQVLRETSVHGLLETKNGVFSRFESSLGEVIDRASDTAVLETGGQANNAPAGLSRSLGDFFNAFHELAASPSDATQRQLVIAKADILTGRFHTVSERLRNVDQDVNLEVDATVNEANVLLERLAELNRTIERHEFSQLGTASELRDERQALLEDLAKLMNFETGMDAGASGSLRLWVRDASSEALLLVDGHRKVAGISYSESQYRVGDTGGIQVTGGKLGAFHEVLTDQLPRLRNDLDSLARQLVRSVNQLYNPEGNATTFFTEGAETASNISTDGSLRPETMQTSQGGLAGGNAIALGIADLGSVRFSQATGDAIEGTFIDFVSLVAGKVGQDLAGVKDQLKDQVLVEDLIKRQRDAVSSVSMDEEVTDLLRFQRAFQASSRVINVLDRMLETVVAGLGR